MTSRDGSLPPNPGPHHSGDPNNEKSQLLPTNPISIALLSLLSSYSRALFSFFAVSLLASRSYGRPSSSNFTSHLRPKPNQLFGSVRGNAPTHIEILSSDATYGVRIRLPKRPGKVTSTSHALRAPPPPTAALFTSPLRIYLAFLAFSFPIAQSQASFDSTTNDEPNISSSTV